jgi:hypothetical protein
VRIEHERNTIMAWFSTLSACELLISSEFLQAGSTSPEVQMIVCALRLRQILLSVSVERTSLVFPDLDSQIIFVHVFLRYRSNLFHFGYNLVFIARPQDHVLGLSEDMVLPTLLFVQHVHFNIPAEWPTLRHPREQIDVDSIGY